MVRTVQEFHAYPHDPITRLGISPTLVLWMIGVEDVYPWGDTDTEVRVATARRARFEHGETP